MVDTSIVFCTLRIRSLVVTLCCLCTGRGWNVKSQLFQTNLNLNLGRLSAGYNNLMVNGRLTNYSALAISRHNASHGHFVRVGRFGPAKLGGGDIRPI